ncbi:uncharacterized protein Z519_00391 [Cladophialophora bantiana CBS 173.52]|uniref:Uncharacterized protein n=1 Tax=Cladophialophora bantiana (strain ATCC 10958 / CBS 173.52 / CDC B-1940 / NIH 8579) TaxID=1442370 RepID=A0A0D2HZ22_CLAB1|nr:uncharacterized protein Z519_00391 [Cladophialophora bantiana CBS 173.52]KIW98728.1 hypothetical protein Z519_00391 [Cladophialophora bantiana CBS 173.52]
MPLGLDDDELEAFIGIYKLRPKQEPKTDSSHKLQPPTSVSGLPSTTRRSTRHDLSPLRGEERVRGELQQLSPVEEEQPDSHYGSRLTTPTTLPQFRGDIRDPSGGNGNTTSSCFPGFNDEMWPRKLTHSTSLPTFPQAQRYYANLTLPLQDLPSRNIWRRQFSWADEFEKELRDIDIKHTSRPKARSANKSRHSLTQSDISSTSSSLRQIPKSTPLFWRPETCVRAQDSTSEAEDMESGKNAEDPADRRPRQTSKQPSCFERLVKLLQSRGSNYADATTGSDVAQHDARGHPAEEKKSRV